MGGDLDAVQAAEAGYNLTEQLGYEFLLSGAANLLAIAYYADGRLEEAEEWSDRSLASARSDLNPAVVKVLALADRPEDAAEALEQALDRYERKENLVMAERVRGRPAELRPWETEASSPVEGR